MSTTASAPSSDGGTGAPTWKRIALIGSPFLVIATCHLVATWSVPKLGIWAWVPLQVAYWSVLALICCSSGHLSIVSSAYRRSTTWSWWAINVIAGLIPLPILLRNTSLLRMHSLVAYWLLIAVLNPFFEEAYWRGLLGSLTAGWTTVMSLAYTSLFFALAHPLLWGVFSIGNRSWQTFAALIVMGAVWSGTFRQTHSLQAVTLSHCLVDVGNMTVWVFMNLYVPPR